MRYIKESGFLGVKIHPDYQEAYITDEGYVRIMECAREYDLIVITHSGIDAGYRDKPVRCPPELALELIRRVPHKKFVLAHLGANEMIEEMLLTLAGEDVYFDTAVTLPSIDEKTFREVIKRHGEDKILFATDSPWSSIEDDVKKLRSFGLSKETENKILYENARGLLGI
jgi:predicted TIM-barrel fold metal-dependent hydrolase